MDIMSMNWCVMYGRNMFRQDSERLCKTALLASQRVTEH